MWVTEWVNQEVEKYVECDSTIVKQDWQKHIGEYVYTCFHIQTWSKNIEEHIWGSLFGWAIA